MAEDKTTTLTQAPATDADAAAAAAAAAKKAKNEAKNEEKRRAKLAKFAAKQAKVYFEQQCSEHCCHVPLGGSFDSYSTTYFSHSLRSKRSKLQPLARTLKRRRRRLLSRLLKRLFLSTRHPRARRRVTIKSIRFDI